MPVVTFDLSLSLSQKLHFGSIRDESLPAIATAIAIAIAGLAFASEGPAIAIPRASRRFFRRRPGVFVREKFLFRKGEIVTISRDGMLVKLGMNPWEGEVARC